MNQEGWLDELSAWSSWHREDLADSIPKSPVLSAVPGLLPFALGIKIGCVSNAETEQPALADNDRLGNGVMDTFTEKMDVDYNGADWYPDGQYQTDTDGNPIVQTLDLSGQSLNLRPSLFEQSDWDDDAPEFDLWLPIMSLFSAPGSIKRNQIVRGNSVHIALDWDALSEYERVYVTAKLEGTSVMEGVEVWFNTTMCASDGEVLTIPIANVTGHTSDGGVPIYMSDTESSFSSPVITVWIYEKEPESVTDMVDLVRNTLFANVYYIRAQMDDAYLATYLSMQADQKRNAETMRVGLFVLGAVMILTAPFTGGTSLIWGADLMCIAYTGKSMFDHIIHGAARLSRQMGWSNISEDTINSFQFMYFVSDKSMDLLLQEFVASGMSSAAGKIGGRLGRLTGRGSSVLTKGTSEVVEQLGGRFSGILTSVSSKLGTLSLSKMMSRLSALGSNLLTAVKTITKVYVSTVMEVIFEFSFDQVMAIDNNMRPGFGTGTDRINSFFAVMTTATLIGGGLGAFQKFKPSLFIKHIADNMHIGRDVTRFAWGSAALGKLVQGVTWMVAAPAIIGMMK